MTVDIEKLKALALAYVYEDGDHWYSVGQLADGITYDPAVNFIADCSAAAVLELIAEVERLSAELAAGAARQGGNTSQVGCERDDGLLNIHAESETCEVCSAPAAGTVEKDAERYRCLRDLMLSAKGGASLTVNQELAYYETPEPGEEVCFQFYPDTPVGFYAFNGTTLDEVADAVVEQFGAHTKAGKEE
jgi:hypothetical protein